MIYAALAALLLVQVRKNSFTVSPVKAVGPAAIGNSRWDLATANVRGARGAQRYGSHTAFSIYCQGIRSRTVDARRLVGWKESGAKVPSTACSCDPLWWCNCLTSVLPHMHAHACVGFMRRSSARGYSTHIHSLSKSNVQEAYATSREAYATRTVATSGVHPG